jgi:ATP-dependent DNA helicase RecG
LTYVKLDENCLSQSLHRQETLGREKGQPHKQKDAYSAAYNYRAELEPKFYSDATSFWVTLYNLNYNIPVDKVATEEENVSITSNYVAIEGLNARKGTIEKAKAVFAKMKFDGIFGRSDIVSITNDSATAAGNLMSRLKDAGRFLRCMTRDVLQSADRF